MTWWSSLYFALYVTFCLWSVTDDPKQKTEPSWHVVLEIVGDICVLLVALAYWVPSVRFASSAFLLEIYVLGLAVTAVQIVRSFWKNVVTDQKLPKSGKVFVGIAGSALVAIVTGPALVWGFFVAVLGRASA